MASEYEKEIRDRWAARTGLGSPRHTQDIAWLLDELAQMRVDRDEWQQCSRDWRGHAKKAEAEGERLRAAKTCAVCPPNFCTHASKTQQGYAAGYEAGAAEMRERAAAHVTALWSMDRLDTSAAIRALPLTDPEPEEDPAP